MPVTRRVKRQRTSAIDRILQLISTGVGVASTVKGIQQREEALALSSRSLDLAEARQFELEDQKLIDEFHESRVQKAAELLAADPLLMQQRAREATDALQGIGGGLGSLTIMNSALVAEQFVERNKMINARDATELLASSLTLDQVKDPVRRDAFRDMLARQQSRRTGQEVAPEAIPENALINTGPTSLGDLINATEMVQLLQNPGAISTLAGLALSRSITGKAEPLSMVLARAGAQDQKVGEMQTLALKGDPQAARMARTWLGLPEEHDIVMDIPDAVAEAMGFDSPVRLMITEDEQANILAGAMRAYMADTVGRVGRASQIREAAVASYATLLRNKMPIGVDESLFIANGGTRDYRLAQMAGFSGTEEEYDASAGVAAMRNIDDQFRDLRLHEVTMVYLQDTEQYSPMLRSIGVMKMLELDPNDLGDVEKAIPVLEKMNQELIANGKPAAYSVPVFKPGDEGAGPAGGMLWWKKQADWFAYMEQAGRINTDMNPGLGPLLPPGPGQAQGPPQPTGQPEIQAAQVISAYRETQKLTVAQMPVEEREAYLGDLRQVVVNGVPIFTDADIAAMMELPPGGVSAAEAAFPPEREQTPQEEIFALREEEKNLKKTRGFLLADLEGGHEGEIANLDKTIARIQADIAKRRAALRPQ